MSKVIEIFKWFILVVLILVSGVGLAIFIKTLDRKAVMFDQGEPSDDPNDLMAPTARLHYEQVAAHQTDFKKIVFENISICADDGVRLDALLHKGNRSEETVILVHGYRSSPENDFSNIVGMYEQRGCNILCVINRAHGSSGGRYIGFSELDAYDLILWQKKTAQMFKDTKILIHGVSMGGATVVHACDKSIDNVIGGISDCGFTSIADITRYLMDKTYKLPYFPFGYAAQMWSMLIAGIRFSKNNGYDNVARTKIPMCFIHGKQDNFVPVWMGVQLYKKCNCELKEMHVVQNCGHAAACFAEEENYCSWINEFMDKCLKWERG